MLAGATSAAMRYECWTALWGTMYNGIIRADVETKMIELPEAITIAGQITEALRGKQITEGIRGNSPHKFAFYNREPAEYAAILKDKTVGKARDHGWAILVPMEPDYVLVLGEGGERILFHESERTLPKKHQLLLRFTDDTCLSVSVQGWGAALLLHESEVATHPHLAGRGPSPLTEEFTWDYFLRLFGGLKEEDSRAVKFFMISKPGILGVGNGVLQDILFNAGIHPKRKVMALDDDEKRSLYAATRSTLREMADLGGRDSDRDLYNRLGGYKRILDSTKVGQPCPRCGTPIEKISFLGGASYYCPTCQT